MVAWTSCDAGMVWVFDMIFKIRMIRKEYQIKNLFVLHLYGLPLYFKVAVIMIVTGLLSYNGCSSSNAAWEKLFGMLKMYYGRKSSGESLKIYCSMWMLTSGDITKGILNHRFVQWSRKITVGNSLLCNKIVYRKYLYPQNGQQSWRHARLKCPVFLIRHGEVHRNVGWCWWWILILWLRSQCAV